MNWYIIHSFESSYGGLHGIEDWHLAQCKDEDEAYELGLEDALDVIYSYSFLMEEIEEEANELWERNDDSIDENERDQWIDEVIEEIAHERAEVEVWQLQDGIDYLQLEEDGMDYEEMRDKYAVKGR